MKKILMIALLVLAGPAIAEVTFEQVDADGDGAITGAELQNAIEAAIDVDNLLDEIDWEADDLDGDGMLSRSEYAEAIAQIKD